MKLLKAANTVFFAILLFFVVALTLLVGTTAGNKLLLKSMSGFIDVDVNYNQWQGNILSSIHISQLEVTPINSESSWLKFRCNSCKITWDYKKIFTGRLKIDQLQLSGLEVYLANPQESQISSPDLAEQSDNIPAISWPLTTAINNIHVENFSLYRSEKLLWQQRTLKAGAKIFGDSINIVAKGNQWSGVPVDAEITLRLHHDLELNGTVDLPWKNRPKSHIELSVLCRQLSVLQCRGDVQWLDLLSPDLSHWRSDGKLSWQLSDQLLQSKIQLLLERPELQHSEFNFISNVEADLDTSILTLSESSLSRLDSHVSGAAQIDWSNGLLVDGQWDVKNIHSDVLSPLLEWPKYLADINAGGSIKLSYNNRDSKKPKASLVASKLSLESGVHRLVGQGEFLWQKINNVQHWHASQWQLNGDDAAFKADIKGLDGRILSADTYLDSRNLASWLDGIQGDLRAKLAVDGDALLATVISDQLTWQNLRGKNVILSTELALDQNKPWQQWSCSSLELEGELIKILNGEVSNEKGVKGSPSFESLGQIKFLASGTAGNHQLTLSQSSVDSIGSDRIDSTLLEGAHLVASGQWVDDVKWQGKITDLSIKPRGSEHWLLKNPVNLTLTQRQQQWQALCLERQTTAGILCFKPGSLKAGEGQIDLTLQQWPLSREDTPLPLIYKNLDPRWDFSGSVNAQSTLDITPNGFVGQGEVYSDAAGLKYKLDEETLHWPLNPASIKWQFDPENIRWQGRVTGSGSDHIVSKGWLQSALNNWQINASIDGRWSQLQTLQPFFVDTDELQGVMKIALKVQGDTTAPKLDGQLQLEQGSVLIPQSGTRFNNWNIILNADGNAIDVQGQGLIGEGAASVYGVLMDDSRDRRIHLKLQGEDLELINNADLQLRSDINLLLVGAALDWNISGDVRVKNSSLELHELPQAAVHLSRDQVLVGEAGEREKPLQVTADLQLILDNSVKFKGFGLESNVHGHLNLRQDDQQQQFAYGSLNLEDGFYKKYSQQLKIETGQLIFNGDVNNPQIVVRAERDFNGVTVGLELGGSALEPESKLYSSEPMSDVDKLSYLISGRPMSEAGTGAANEMQNAAIALGLSQTLPLLDGLSQKVGISSVGLENDNDNTTAIAVAKHLNEQLSVKYLYGLINNSARIVMEYRFNRNFSIEASSGDSQAMDLRYRWFSNVPKDDSEK